MSDFKAKMHQIRFRPLGKLTAPPDSLAGFRGPTSKGEGKEGVDPQAQGFAEMTPLLNVRPKKGEVCFTVSDVGGLISHPWWGGGELFPPLPSPSHSPHSLPPFPFPSLRSGLPLIQLGGMGERCKLPQRGLGRSPSQNRIWCILALKSVIWWQQF